nr:hypothetical protein [Tanacetum cinerariifolium]
MLLKFSGSKTHNVPPKPVPDPTFKQVVVAQKPLIMKIIHAGVKKLRRRTRKPSLDMSINQDYRDISSSSKSLPICKVKPVSTRRVHLKGMEGKIRNDLGGMEDKMKKKKSSNSKGSRKKNESYPLTKKRWKKIKILPIPQKVCLCFRLKLDCFLEKHTSRQEGHGYTARKTTKYIAATTISRR